MSQRHLFESWKLFMQAGAYEDLLTYPNDKFETFTIFKMIGQMNRTVAVWDNP